MSSMFSSMSVTLFSSSTIRSGVIRCAASAAINGSNAERASAITRYGAWSNCRSRASVAASDSAPGFSTTGPPPGPGLNDSTPCSSR